MRYYKYTCLWCGEYKTGDYIEAVDNDNEVLKWCCWKCQRKLFGTSKKKRGSRHLKEKR